MKRKRRPAKAHRKRLNVAVQCLNRKRRRKKETQVKVLWHINFFVECNKRLLKYTQTSDGPKKVKDFERDHEEEDITIEDIKSSGIAKTISKLTKHDDSDYQQWSKGLQSLETEIFVVNFCNNVVFFVYSQILNLADN